MRLELLKHYNLTEMRKLTLFQRIMAPVPKFFQRMKMLGLILAAIGGVLVAAPYEIPLVLVNIGGYLIVAGAVATAVAQTAVEEK